MKKMKKILALALAGAMVLSFAACGKKEQAVENVPEGWEEFSDLIKAAREEGELVVDVVQDTAGEFRAGVAQRQDHVVDDRRIDGVGADHQDGRVAELGDTGDGAVHRDGGGIHDHIIHGFAERPQKRFHGAVLDPRLVFLMGPGVEGQIQIQFFITPELVFLVRFAGQHIADPAPSPP